MGTEREELLRVVRVQAATREVWESGELHLLGMMLRDRLGVLHIEPGPEVALALMATAMLLAERSPEWGGDFRDALGEVAQLGLELLGEG